MAREKRQKKTKKRPSTMVLLVIAVLVAVLGIQIVRVYQQLKVARQEEAALSQQLTQQQQENDALRSDLEKKGDESFIKALARDLLGLADEGERIFYDVNDQKETAAPSLFYLSFSPLCGMLTSPGHITPHRRNL